MLLSWYGQLAKVPTTSAELTVLVQALSPYDQGQLLWDVFFPRRNIGSVKLQQMTLPTIKRFVADRREWNARGRFIPYVTPSLSELEMVPIEAWFGLGEREMQDLTERFVGNADLAFQAMRNSLPDRTSELGLANLRRIEVDAFKAWATGTIVAMNAVSGVTETFSFGFDSARYTTAGTPWTGGSGGTAYAELLEWLDLAITAGVPVGGVMLRTATLEAIRSSAPNPFYGFSSTIPVTISQLEQLVTDQLAVPFKFYRNEHTVDVFSGGSTAHTQTKLWPAETIAVVPPGEAVGYTAFAPVVRAVDLARQVPAAKIDVNGQVVFIDEENNGRNLTVECQVNALPVPIETNIWVIDAGI
jgi:hypothetical protein